jgi:hypothetical protein
METVNYGCKTFYDTGPKGLHNKTLRICNIHNILFFVTDELAKYAGVLNYTRLEMLARTNARTYFTIHEL